MINSVLRQHFDTIPSTHTYASGQAHLLKTGLLLLVSADNQTAGRARHNRTWNSPRNEGLPVSFGFLVDKRRTDLGNIPQILALAISTVLKEHGIAPTLKWPNDVLVDKKKIAGILTTAHQPDSAEFIYMVASFGLNVSTSLETLEKLGRPATSLLIETGKALDIDSIREAILDRFVLNLNRFLIDGFPAFLESYKSQIISLINEKINFHFNGEIIEGIFHGITDSGTLLLRLNDGILKEFVSGELEMKPEA